MGCTSKQRVLRRGNTDVWETLKVQHPESSGKHKSKLLWDFTFHQLEWQRSIKPMNAGKDGNGSTSRSNYTTLRQIHKIPYHRGICSIVFIAALYIIARNGKQPR